MLLASVKGEAATRAPSAPAPAARSTETRAEPSAGDVTQTPDTVTATEDVGPAAEASGGSSLFDVAAEEEPDAAPTEPVATTGSSGSLFDLGEAETVADVPSAAEGRPDDGQISDGGSLFDLPGAEPAAKAEPAKAEPTAKAEPEPEIPSGSLFDVPEPEARTPATAPAPAPEAPTAGPSEPPATPAPGRATRLPDEVSLFDLGDEAASAPAPETSPPDTAPADGKLDEGTSLFDL